MSEPEFTMHHMGLAFSMYSPCGREPASVYSGVQGHGYTTDWSEVDCPDCLAKWVGRPTPLQNFYLTFGVKYRREAHPHWEGADPDGWVLITAPDEPAARALAQEYLGMYWSMLYPGTHFTEELNKRMYYPKGTIATISADGATSTVEGVGAPTPRKEDS
jgi:hypothetical protein